MWLLAVLAALVATGNTVTTLPDTGNNNLSSAPILPSSPLREVIKQRRTLIAQRMDRERVVRGAQALCTKRVAGLSGRDLKCSMGSPAVVSIPSPALH